MRSPFFSLTSFACCGVSGFSSAFGVTASSSLPLFTALAALAALADLALGAFFLVDDSAAGVLGVESLSFVAVLGVFAGF